MSSAQQWNLKPWVKRQLLHERGWMKERRGHRVKHGLPQYLNVKLKSCWQRRRSIQREEEDGEDVTAGRPGEDGVSRRRMWQPC